MINKKIPIFVASSDNTHDVFSVVSPSLVESISVDRYEMFVGLNSISVSLPFHGVYAPASNWANELSLQLKQLPSQIEYLVLVLDDFYFYKKTQENKLKNIYKYAVEKNVDYLRLIPVKRSIFARIIRSIFFKKSELIKRINSDEPYYSSLQVAIWKKEYLIFLLESKVNIWEFEHLAQKNSHHFAVCENGIVGYEHLVEKGKWLIHAKNLLPYCVDNSFLKRGWDTRKFYKYKLLRELKFQIYGYSIFKIKRYISNLKIKLFTQ
jgi:hypothetical protein